MNFGLIRATALEYADIRVNAVRPRRSGPYHPDLPLVAGEPTGRMDMLDILDRP